MKKKYQLLSHRKKKAALLNSLNISGDWTKTLLNKQDSEQEIEEEGMMALPFFFTFFQIESESWTGETGNYYVIENIPYSGGYNVNWL